MGGGIQGTPASSSASSSTSPFSLQAQSAPKLTKSAWRKTRSTCQDLIDEILSIQPECPANVLLLGPTWAGKSSLINSILTTAKGRRVNKAYTGNKGTSFTTTYESYMDEGILQHCCLWDSMGIEQVLDGGLLLDDLAYLLKGHIKRGYKFNPRSMISENDPCFRSRPRIVDQIHCVVFVLDAGMVDEAIIYPYMSKITSLQDQAHSLNIPCTLVLTKIDELCQQVCVDIRKTFWSLKIYNAVKTANDLFGIPEGNIHPVRNYETDIETDDAASVLLLIALKQIMYFAFDKIEELKKNQEQERRCIVS